MSFHKIRFFAFPVFCMIVGLGAMGVFAAAHATEADYSDDATEIMASGIIRDGDLQGHSVRPLHTLNGQINGISLLDPQGRLYFTGRKIVETPSSDGRPRGVSFFDEKGNSAVFAAKDGQNDWMICIPLSWKGVGHCLVAYCEYYC